MKLLLDECVPVDFRHHVAGHEVFACVRMGWTGIGNGRLLALAAGNGFDAVITTDGNIEYQINPATMPIAVVVLRIRSNDLADLLPLVPELLLKLGTLKTRAVTHVGGVP